MTETMTTVYECHTEHCTLGTVGSPGRFTGGATKEQITLLTGNPEPEHFGDGVCPNCGKPAEKKVTEPAPHKGRDPYQKLHDEVQARVLDEDDKLDKDGAQDEFMRLVEKKEAKDAPA